MVVLKGIKEVREYILEWKSKNFRIGFIPTMGYLHQGHKSLIEKAIEENDKVVVSIFVNPIQFGPKEDLASYPRNLERDYALCSDLGVDLVFVPEVSEMYYEDLSTFIEVENLVNGLCGKSRPNHFRGVCTVVTKLFNIVSPNNAYFGEKDAQQLAIIKRMVRDLNFNINIVGCPIIREDDGLAKSSRNSYLSKGEREAATILNKSLLLAQEALDKGLRHSVDIINIVSEKIKSEPLAKIDYVEVVNSLTLKKVDYIEDDILVAIAVFIGRTRLIDNFTYKL